MIEYFTSFALKAIVLKTLMRATAAGLVLMLIRAMPWWLVLPALGVLVWWLFGTPGISSTAIA